MNDFIDKEKILKFLKPENIINSISLITADLSRPWLIKQSLIKQTKFMHEIFSEIIAKLSLDKQNQLKENDMK